MAKAPKDPMAKYKIIEVRLDDDGDIGAVRFQDRKNFISLERAVPIAEREEIKDVHRNTSAKGKKHLRSDHDAKKKNNLKSLVKKKKKPKKK